MRITPVRCTTNTHPSGLLSISWFLKQPSSRWPWDNRPLFIQIITHKMSELINNNAAFRKETLRKLILELHEGKDPVEVRHRLKETLKDIPYDEVVEVEQQLMREGLPQEEVLRLSDVHGEVLDGIIDKQEALPIDRKSTRLNSSHQIISYAVFCLKKKKK